MMKSVSIMEAFCYDKLMDYPTVRIKSSFLLNNKLLPLLKSELEESGRQDEGTSDFIDMKSRIYIDAWKVYEQRIMSAMTKVLDMKFNQNIIDVYVAPFGNSFSDPMIISTKYSADRSIEVLTHEIAHRFLTDSDKLPMKDGRRLTEHWGELFGDLPFIVLVHIPVHALMQHIFVDVLNEPERLERDIQICQKHEPYNQAWNYVIEVGYKNIIDKLKSSYDS